MAGVNVTGIGFPVARLENVKPLRELPVTTQVVAGLGVGTGASEP